jgi:hypothetical protein
MRILHGWVGRVIVLATVFSCSGGDSSSSGTCADAIKKFKDCGFTFLPANADICVTSPPDACTMGCMDQTSCAGLQKSYCSGMGFSKTDPFFQCIFACQEASKLKCGVGTETYSKEDKCNGFQNCSNNADEAGCKDFACGDGSSVSENSRCDGRPNCENGADEAGCPAGTPKNVKIELFCSNGVRAGSGSSSGGGGGGGGGGGVSSPGSTSDGNSGSVSPP